MSKGYIRLSVAQVRYVLARPGASSRALGHALGVRPWDVQYARAHSAGLDPKAKDFAMRCVTL